MVHSTDVPVSTEQLTKVVNLLQRQRALRESSNTSTNQSSVESCKPGEETPLSKRFAKVPCFSVSTDQVYAHGIKRPSMSSDGTCDSDHEPLMLRCKSSRINETTGDQKKFRDQTKSSLVAGNNSSKSCRAQWDVFRRQDVPRLSEYLRRHSDELVHKHVSPEHIVSRISMCRSNRLITHCISCRLCIQFSTRIFFSMQPTN